MGQLSTELSVVFFGLFFARLESSQSILRIMYLTVPISLLYISVQVSEFVIFIEEFKSACFVLNIGLFGNIPS